MRQKYFSSSIIIFKKAMNRNQFKYALSDCIEETGRENLKTIIESIYRITGRQNMEQALVVFGQCFHVDNLISPFQRINKVSNKRDSLTFLTSLIQITSSSNIDEACNCIRALTVKKMAVLDILEQIRFKSGHNDIIDFFRKLIALTATQSLQSAWAVLFSLTSVRDIFVLFNTLSTYTEVDVINFFQTMLRITNTTNIRAAASILFKITGIYQLLDCIREIHNIVNKDVNHFFEVFITLSKRFQLEEAILVLENYTGAPGKASPQPTARHPF
ncbi:unnamed protein product [Parnassius mnemosyne]|uniref:Uncharacterized protein n=1 Tax=Parnassius mnemosyne TaxID=213953 RepID=A0AAV1LCS2_9NEOP